MRKKRRWIIAALLLGVLLRPLSSPVSAEIYKWKDKDGRIFYSDSAPPVGVDVEIRRLREDPADTPKTRETPPRPKRNEVGEKRSYKEISVVMYMTTWCRFCRSAREYIRTLDVNLLEYDIEKDKGRRDEMLGKSGGKGGVPLIDIEGTIIRGYNPDAIKAAVEKRRSP